MHIRDAIDDYSGESTVQAESALRYACQQAGIVTLDELADPAKITGKELTFYAGQFGKEAVSLAQDLLGLWDRDAHHLFLR